MIFDIKNLRIVRIDVQEGVSQKTGNQWKKLNVTFREEVNGYSSQIVADVFGLEDVELFQKEHHEGEQVDVQFRANTQEYNGRTFNNISVLHCNKVASGPQAGFNQPIPRGQQTAPSYAGAMPQAEIPKDNDLPF